MRSRALLLLGLLLLSLPLAAEQRPRIGLVLAGGGAKGSAHVAVLEFLEANRIPVDFISGTSIGAYVGGLYALGYDARQIKTIMYNQGLNRGYSDAIRRDDLPYRNKRHEDKFNLPVEMGYRDGELHFPGGLLYGQTMSSIYLGSVGNLVNLHSFDDLAIPFRAVATDLTTGETVALSRGNLIRAMQASATVPGALVPMEIEGRYLVDGGISNNIPIAEVKQMGADIVIAVDISAPLLPKDSLKNSIAILRQLSNLLTIKNITAQKQLLGEKDVYIRPKVDDLSFTDFGNLPLAYEAGRIAVLDKREELVVLGIEASAYAAYQQQKQQRLGSLKRLENQPLAELNLLNTSGVSDTYLLKTLGVKAGEPVTNEELRAGLQRVYALDRFQRVEAEFVKQETGLGLVVNAEGKSWGPNIFEMGVGWEDDFTLDSVINFDLSYTIGEITDNDGEWRNELGLGTNKSFISELYLPIDAAHNFYNRERYEFQKRSHNYFIDNQRTIIFEQSSDRLDFSLGYKLQVDAIIEAGITLEAGRISNELSLQDNLNYQSRGIFLRSTWDSLDRASFPTRGQRFDLSISYREEDVDGDLINGDPANSEPYFTTQYAAAWKGAVSDGNHGLVGIASLTYLDSDTNQSIFFEQLGGFLNLSGYHKNALVGNSKAFGAISYQYNLGRGVFGLKDFPLYIGGSLEAGNVWASSDSIRFRDLITASSLFFATNTALGPVALAFGFAEDNFNAVYFYLGKNI